MDPFLEIPNLRPRRAGAFARMKSGLWRALWSSAFLSLAIFGQGVAAREIVAQDTTGLKIAARNITAPDTVTVLAAGDLRGEIKPCGCSEKGQMGGLLRRLSYLEKMTGQGREADGAPIVVDLGNNFPEPTPQGRFKIELIETLLEMIPPDAILPGPGEMRAGAAGLSRKLPYVLGNDRAGKRFAPVVRVRRKGRTISIHGYLSPSLVYQAGQSHFRLEGARAALGLFPPPEPGETALLLFRGSDEELALLASSGRFALIVAGNPSADELKQITERIVGATPYPQVPTKGQGLLRIELALPAPNGKAASLGGNATGNTTGNTAGNATRKPTVDWLKESWPDHPAAAPVFAKYDERVKGLFFARMEIMARQQRESVFAGAQSCLACHPPAREAWKKSRHAGALATLEKVGKQFDPECLACHVVGLDKGGFLSQDLTPDLANVQCENCHGPGKAHVKNPAERTGPPVGIPVNHAASTAKKHAASAANNNAAPVANNYSAPAVKPDERTCRTCHRGSHSPTFAFSTYWPKIAHSK